ncbi:MAG: hypothetical protein FJ119_01565 [Deltaproteobacteria bacterium]|nr:hypothetical protein [Deltaproteobacteria bacterium]
MSEHISKEQAQEIVLRHLGIELQNFFGILDGIPEEICVYLPSQDKKDYWCMFVPKLDGIMAVGGCRFICVSKKTGKVTFDGIVGE